MSSDICKVTYVIVSTDECVYESEKLSLIESVSDYGIYCGEFGKDEPFNKIFCKTNILNLSCANVISIFNRICKFEDSKISCIYRVTGKYKFIEEKI